jgi:hypothetical protein
VRIVFAYIFHHPEIIAECSSLAVKKGNWGCPEFPRKPDLPRKWGAWDLQG